MPSVLRTRAALAAVLLAASVAPPVPADDAPKPAGGAAGATPKPAPTPEEAYQARLRDCMVLIGKGYESAATFAMGNKLRRSALSVYQLALEFAPDNERARRELGYDRKGVDWVANEAKQKKLDEIEDESEKKRADFEKKVREAAVAGGRMLAELGELSERAGDAGRAGEHWKRALQLDDQNALANQKRGNRLVEGKWFTERALNHKEFKKVYDESLSKAQKLEVAVVATDETSGVAEKAGIQVKRIKTKNFRFESVLPEADIKQTLIWLERSREFFVHLFDIPERFVDYAADPMVFVVVSTDEQKDKLIDACTGIPDKEKAFKKKFGAVAVGGKLELARFPTGAMAERESIHIATHTMVRDSLGQHAPWLTEALANSVAAAVKQAHLKVCFSGEGSTAGIHLENISLDQVPALLRELVSAKKDDSIGEFVKLPADGLKVQHIAKAWSVVMYLLERDRAQAREYFSGAGQGNGGDNSKSDKVLAQYFEEFKTWKDLDVAWREWVLDVYRN